MHRSEQKEAQWYHARFAWNGEWIEAFYNDSGQLVSAARVITIDRLPIAVRKGLAENYPGHTVRQIVECTNESRTTYIVSVCNNRETVVLKYFPGGSSRRIRRIRKKS